MKSAKPVSDYKKKLVSELAEKIRNSRTILIASTKGLPGSQFHEIKKSLRGKAEIRVAKKSIITRALSAVEKGAVQNLKELIKADIAIFFSSIDAFELSALLSDNKSSAKAKVGDIAPEDITIEPGPTELMPGPAISELSSVGLKVAVESGKIAIKQPATLVKKGDKINEKIANVLGKLNITPMKVGFEPLAAYDAESDKVYTGIRIDKSNMLNELKSSIAKALGFAVNIIYPVKETISLLIAKASSQEKALNALIQKSHKEEA